MVPTGNRGNLPLYQEQYLQQPLRIIGADGRDESQHLHCDQYYSG